jgi:hypothetical protein
MYYLAVATDLIHAIAMVAWIFGLPLLFWHKYNKLSLSYGSYSLFFILVNQVSHYTLGKCVLTSISQYFWEHSENHADTSEWFAVRFSNMIFGLTPTHNSIKILTECLIAVSAIGGMFFSFRKLKYNVREKEI